MGLPKKVRNAFSTVVHHLKVQKFEPVLKPVEPVLQVQVHGSGKVVKEPDRTELQQPYAAHGHGQRLPFWVHKLPHLKWYHTLQPSTTTFTLSIVKISGLEWKSKDVLGTKIFIFTLDGAEEQKM